LASLGSILSVPRESYSSSSTLRRISSIFQATCPKLSVRIFSG
jgi:hypothetical protein